MEGDWMEVVSNEWSDESKNKQSVNEVDRWEREYEPMDKANIQEKKFESSQKRHTNMMNSVKDDRKGQNTLNGDGVNS